MKNRQEHEYRERENGKRPPSEQHGRGEREIAGQEGPPPSRAIVPLEGTPGDLEIKCAMRKPDDYRQRQEAVSGTRPASTVPIATETTTGAIRVAAGRRAATEIGTVSFTAPGASLV